jgi:hypothetical protein
MATVILPWIAESSDPISSKRRDRIRMVAAHIAVFAGCTVIIIVAQWDTLVAVGVFGWREPSTPIHIGPPGFSISIFLPLILASAYSGWSRLVVLGVLGCLVAALGIWVGIGAGNLLDAPALFLESAAALTLLVFGFIGSRATAEGGRSGYPPFLWSLLAASSLWIPLSDTAGPGAWFLWLIGLVVVFFRFPPPLDASRRGALVVRGAAIGVAISAAMWVAEHAVS